MGTRAEELKGGCLSKVADDEPVFVLRARDKLAPMAVQVWAAYAEIEGVDPDKVREARLLASAMWRWQKEHGSKLPD